MYQSKIPDMHITVLTKSEYISEIARSENLKKVNRESKSVVPKQSFYLRHIKRYLDLAIAVPAFIILLPVNGILGILTWLDVGSPVFFRQKRTGKDGRPFYLVKFRNMTSDTDRFGNLLPAEKRVTRFGKFVRKYSLDELMNFWSILKGDMSLIGPRPLPAEFRERFSDRHRMREAVKPGLECPSIQAGKGIRFYQQQFENDIWYVENASFLVDCKMVWKLFCMVINFRERGDHAKAGGGDFLGYDAQGNAFSMRNVPEKYEKQYEKYQQIMELL